MKGKLRFVCGLFFIIGIVYYLLPSSPSLSIKEGKVDLSEHLFSKQPVLKLNGEWQFQWKVIGEGSNKDNEKATFVHVPDTWTNYKDQKGNRLPPTGYATYKLRIKVPKDTEKSYALYVPEISTSYELWVDGKQMYRNGEIGTNKENTIPDNKPAVVPIELSGTDINLSIIVANYHHIRAGLWNPIEFGERDMLIQYRQWVNLQEAFIIGGLFIIAVYHAIFYSKRRNDKAPLYFSILCIMVALRTAAVGSNPFHAVFPFLSWEIVGKIEDITTYLGFLSFYYYIHSILRQSINRKHLRVLWVISVTFSLISLFTSTFYGSYVRLAFAFVAMFVFAYFIYLSIKAYKENISEAVWNLIGSLILALGVIHDILVTYRVYDGEFIANLAVIIYMVIHISLNSAKFASSYSLAEQLSEEYNLLNKVLENKVEERTVELEEAYAKLKKNESDRSQLISNICHDLSNPVTSIRVVSKGLLDGVIPINKEQFVSEIYDQSALMDKLLTDLRQLTLLENHQLSFDFEKVEWTTFIKRLFESYEIKVASEHLQYSIWEDGLHEHETVFIDPLRIEQVYSNIITNSIKFTPTPGRIDVETGVNEVTRTAYFSIRDTGIGIEENLLPTIYERFYKTEPLRKDKRSSGLGLNIIKSIVATHEGYITVESKLGKGTCFTVQIPLAQQKTII